MASNGTAFAAFAAMALGVWLVDSGIQGRHPIGALEDIIRNPSNVKTTLAADKGQFTPTSTLIGSDGGSASSPSVAGGGTKVNPPPVSGGKFAPMVERWRSTVAKALKARGIPDTPHNENLTLFQMSTESGGNPNSINLWDSNAKAGHPSQGLMQTIPGTFQEYAGPYANRGIDDPFANIYAALGYAESRYGSLDAAFQGHGY